MTVCKQSTFDFQALGGRKVTADFSGGYLSSDGGALLLREVEKAGRLIERLATCFEDGRNPAYVEHPLEQMLRQRIFGLATGYEDLNDFNRLRYDPLHALLAERSDLLGQERLHPEDQGKALAGHATLNRLELGAEGTDGRYKKITPDVNAIEALLIAEGVKRIPRKSKTIILDFDATDDPLHGKQEGAFFHGYYNSYCYLPLYCFCGSIPLWAELRDAKRDACDGTTEALEKIIPAIWKRFGRKTKILLRGDSGFARESIMRWCEDHGVEYVLGLAKNNRLNAELDEAFGEIKATVDAGSELPQRRFADFSYQTQTSWSCQRRVIGKAEWLERGKNPRFIVTNIKKASFAAAELYEEIYCARGDMENRIKEEQMDLFADRTSTHWESSNQLRLWFSAFAHLLVSILRADVLKGTEFAHASVGQIRVKLFKIGARIKVSCRRVHIELVSAYPWIKSFARAHAQTG
jgi:hypothetical protein